MHQLLQPESAAMPLGGMLPRAVRATKLARVGRTLLRLVLLSLSALRMLSCCLLLLVWLQQAVARCGGLYLEHELAPCRRDDVATRLRDRGDDILHPARKHSRGRVGMTGADIVALFVEGKVFCFSNLIMSTALTATTG